MPEGWLQAKFRPKIAPTAGCAPSPKTPTSLTVALIRKWTCYRQYLLSCEMLVSSTEAASPVVRLPFLAALSKKEKKKKKKAPKATHLFAGLQGYGICHFQAVNCRREIQLGSGEFLDAVACPVGRHGCLLVISCMCSLQWSQPDSPLCSRDVIGKPPGKRPVPGVFKKSYYI